jgi:hypothetical protein
MSEKEQIPPGEARVPPQGEGARGSSEPMEAEQEEPAEPEEQDAGGIPPALAKLHKRLSKEVELYKLHLKHYHMSVTQFRRRTNRLALPESVYEKYEHICRTCKVCSQYARPPARSRISGIRAENFGDIIFVDYAEIKVEGARGGNVVALLLLDGATSVLWAQAQRSYEAGETLDSLREWRDIHSCRPRTICGDSAFFQPHFQKWYRGESIKDLPTGPETPWPNRAESAVRLFKKQFALLVQFTNEDPVAKVQSYAQLVRLTAWARNNQLTISRRLPLFVQVHNASGLKQLKPAIFADFLPLLFVINTKRKSQ